MDKDSVYNFIPLYMDFQSRCNLIAVKLSKYNPDFKGAINNNWRLDYSNEYRSLILVYNTVNIYKDGNLVCVVNIDFPIDLLFQSDEEVDKYGREQYGE